MQEAMPMFGTDFSSWYRGINFQEHLWSPDSQQGSQTLQQNAFLQEKGMRKNTLYILFKQISMY